MDAILTAVRQGERERRRVRDRVRSVGGGENGGGKEKKRRGDGQKDSTHCSAKKGSRGQKVRGDTFIEIRGRVRITQR